MPSAEVISVGTELLLGQILDTHAPTMARILAECGIGCQRRHTIGDNLQRLTEAISSALDRVDIVVCIGGLGPTQDDLTRDAIAAALGEDLVRDEGYATQLRNWFRSRNYPFAESNLRQADRPKSAEFIENPNGTAPGLLCQRNMKVVIALPGPKGEFDPMALGPVKAFLSTASGGSVIHSRTLRICGVGESHVEKQILHLLDSTNPTVAPYAHVGEVHLRLTASAASVPDADALIDPMEHKIRAILGDSVFGINATTLEAAVLQELHERKMTLAIAESMTGGGLGSRLTNVSGASKVFQGGVIVYTPQAKQALLAVNEPSGPVSRETAQALAEAVREKLGTDFGIAIVGNAGPTSDVDGKPVGLTFVAIASDKGVVVDETKFRGQREDIRRRAEQTALVLLRTTLIDS
jgi:nicotinamide-nucleotide amidase